MSDSPTDRLPYVDPATKSMEEIVALCKRRGFVYPASEIYGGLNGFWDYGPLGTALKNNIRDWWWHCMVDCPPIGPDGNPVSIVGLDSSIIQNPKTWEASGHVGGFSDPMVDDRETKSRYRADHIMVLQPKSGEGRAYAFMEGDQEKAEKRITKAKGSPADYETVAFMDLDASAYVNIMGPEAKEAGTLTEPRAFNLMFMTYVGALASEDNKAYLRPETAQGIFLNFKNVLDTMRVKVPFGIAQIGKSFRNEVTPRNFIFRSREFEQMEMEFFCPPDESRQWYEFWRDERYKWWLTLGVDERNLILREHDDDEMAHYSNACVDVEYRYPFSGDGYGELEGVAHRGCYDLTQHTEHSGKDLSYFDQELQLKLQAEGVDKAEIKERSRYIPHVIEPASGLTRAVLVMLCEAFTPTPDRKGSAYTLSFKPKFAPVKAGVYPLVNKDGMPEVARKLYDALRSKHTVEYDAKQAIGKRYARMDEIGTPFCFTVDGETLTDQTVTVRHRDSQAQERVALDKVEGFLSEHLASDG